MNHLQNFVAVCVVFVAIEYNSVSLISRFFPSLFFMDGIRGSTSAESIIGFTPSPSLYKRSGHDRNYHAEIACARTGLLVSIFHNRLNDFHMVWFYHLLWLHFSRFLFPLCFTQTGNLPFAMIRKDLGLLI